MEDAYTIQRAEGFRVEDAHDAPKSKTLVLLGATGDDQNAEVVIGRYEMPEDLWLAIKTGEREFVPA